MRTEMRADMHKSSERSVEQKEEEVCSDMRVSMVADTRAVIYMGMRACERIARRGEREEARRSAAAARRHVAPQPAHAP